MRIYLHSILRYAAFYTLGFVFFSFSVEPLAAILRNFFPSLFPTFNPIFEKEAYIASYATIEIIAAVIAILLSTVVAIRFDNERYEGVIKKTDGFYTIKSALPIYFSDFWKADLISAVLVPIPFIILAAIKFPEKIVDWINIFVISTQAFTNEFGFVLGSLIIILASIIFRIPAAVSGLFRWRGLWLSDIGK